MGQTPSDRLETVADVAAAIEAAGNEITDLRVTVDDDGGHGTAQVSVPIIEEDVDTACEFDLAAATLTDSTLQIELDVGTETLETTRDETTPPAAATTETPDGDGADSPAGAEQSTACGETSSAASDSSRPDNTDASAGSTDDEPAPAEHDSTQSEAEGAADSAHSEAAADSDASVDADCPAYRDPDKLTAVYDPEATFPEMTDALGVDVTPQTVRKYMIEHGIHEPTSRTSDTLTETHVDGEEVTSAEIQSEHDAKTPDPETGESQPTSAETAPANEAHSQPSGGDTREDDTSAPETSTPERPDTATELVESEESGATASAHTDDDKTVTTEAQTSGNEAADTTADPPDEAARATSTTTSTATDGGTQPTLSAVESLELPGEVSVAELVSVLTDSRTVYEVRRGLGVDDTQTRTILRQYDLIDLVTGRITQGSEPPDRQEVLSRLIEASDQAA
ncbi:hypothetical protein EXE44_13690 [Halorubrum sp. SS7]|uniref:hypothetical protein n=1 Tax=Halorubrum sp. SS7 TaxID=2518119 RepID=UPI0010F87029|nr:hypothetical protein [Halorubrum sp. SS7]TKX56675.1 hypothetical protein EXE44_13690 [Halorubrum sp. SS7]